MLTFLKLDQGEHSSLLLSLFNNPGTSSDQIENLVDALFKGNFKKMFTFEIFSNGCLTK